MKMTLPLIALLAAAQASAAYGPSRADRFSIGCESTVSFTSSLPALNLDFAGSSLEGTASDGVDTASGELAYNTQVVIGERYVHELGAGFAVGLGVARYDNALVSRTASRRCTV